MNLVNVGFGNNIPTGRIIAIIDNDSSPIKRSITDARERHMLIDATQGRKTRAVIFMDSGHLVLSSLQPETLTARITETV